MILVVSVFALLGCLSSEGLHLTSVVPQSINVSEGTQVNFTCQTLLSDVDVGITIQPPDTMPKNRMDTNVILPDGGEETIVSFTATAAVNETIIQCIATSPSDVEITQASLLVQGPPAGVSDLRVEYEDVCCTLVAWDDPYTLSGVPITGYSITVNNMSSIADSVIFDNTLCLTGPGSYVVEVIALIDDFPGDAAEIVVDIHEIKFNLSVQQVQGFLQFTVEISKECNITSVKNVTIILNELALTVDEFTSSGFTEDDDNQIVESRKLEEFLLNRHLQALAFVTFANGIVITTVTKNFSTFDVQTASYAINSVGAVCVECELIPGTQAQGCHVILDCDNSDVIEQDFTRSGFTATGCLSELSTTPTSCTLLLYDIEKNGNVANNPAVSIYNVVIPGVVFSHALSSSPTTMGMITTGTPNNSATNGTTNVILSITVGVLAVLVITISLTLLVVSVCFYRTRTQIKEWKTAESEKPATDVDYENTNFPTGIRMQECPAYATVTHEQ